jgi:hypothetical protein
MRVDPGIAGILIAIGFLVMGIVSMPVATGFVVGAITLGVVIALILRFTSKKFARLAVGTVIILAGAALWWEGHRPARPHTVSSNALYVLPNNVPFTLHKTGYWVDCWFDPHANVDRCKLADESGTALLEDVFLPCVGQFPVPKSELVFNAQMTGSIWTRSPDKRINVPVIHLDDGQVLLPRSFYAEAKRDARCGL